MVPRSLRHLKHLPQRMRDARHSDADGRLVVGCVKTTKHDSTIDTSYHIFPIRYPQISCGTLYQHTIARQPCDSVMVRRCVEAIPRGHQSYSGRFPGRKRIFDDAVPPLAPWRSNLV